MIERSAELFQHARLVGDLLQLRRVVRRRLHPHERGQEVVATGDVHVDLGDRPHAGCRTPVVLVRRHRVRQGDDLLLHFVDVVEELRPEAALGWRGRVGGRRLLATRPGQEGGAEHEGQEEDEAAHEDSVCDSVFAPRSQEW